MSTEPLEYELPEPRALAKKLAVGLVGVFAVVALLGYGFRGPIVAASTWFVGTLGLGGVFVGVLLADMIPVMTHDPFLFAGHSGGLATAPLATVAMIASMLAAWLDFGLGRLIGDRSPRFRAILERWRIPALLRTHGMWAMALVALLPLPFALVAWGAGMSGSPFANIVLASMVRASKVLLTLGVIHLGWSIGG